MISTNRRLRRALKLLSKKDGEPYVNGEIIFSVHGREVSRTKTKFRISRKGWKDPRIEEVIENPQDWHVEHKVEGRMMCHVGFARVVIDEGALDRVVQAFKNQENQEIP